MPTENLAGQLLITLRPDPYFMPVDMLRRTLGVDGFGLRTAIIGINRMGISLVSAKRSGEQALAIARESKLDADYSGQKFWDSEIEKP